MAWTNELEERVTSLRYFRGIGQCDNQNIHFWLGSSRYWLGWALVSARVCSLAWWAQGCMWWELPLACAVRRCATARTWVIGACSSPRGWSGTGTGSPASGHSPKASRTQGAFGQCSQGQGGIVGVSCAGPGLVLSDPWGTLPTQHILWFLIGGLWLPSFFGTGPYLKPHSWLGRVCFGRINVVLHCLVCRFCLIGVFGSGW